MGFARERSSNCPRDVVERLLRGMIKTAIDCEHPSGCLVTNGALACSADPIKTEVNRRRSDFEAAMRSRLEEAEAADDLLSDTSPADLEHRPEK